MASTKQPILGMSHLGICVRDLEKSLAFYRDLVGMKVVKEERPVVVLRSDEFAAYDDA